MKSSLGPGIFSLVMLLLCISGCTTMVQKPQQAGYSADIRAILTGRSLLGRDVRMDELPNQALFSITPEMAVFAERAVKRGDNLFDKVKALHMALLSSTTTNGRGIIYNAYSTEVPEVTFAKRSANCLSYTLLYVAMARHLGIGAYVNEVDIPPTWDLRNKNEMVFFRHVNVRIPMRGENGVQVPIRGRSLINSDDVVIDLEMNRYRYDYPQRQISDEQAAAEFYSNRGIELASNGNYEEAFLNLRKAIAEDDRQSHIWSNLASLYARKDILQDAERLYLHGLALNPDDLSIINNLAWLYKRLGNSHRAEAYAKLAEHHRQTNPYYQYNLSLTAFEDKDYEHALVYVQRAIKLEKKDFRFYELAASIYEKLQRPDAANTMTNKAKKLKLH